MKNAIRMYILVISWEESQNALTHLVELTNSKIAKLVLCLIADVMLTCAGDRMWGQRMVWALALFFLFPAVFTIVIKFFWFTCETNVDHLLRT